MTILRKVFIGSAAGAAIIGLLVAGPSAFSLIDSSEEVPETIVEETTTTTVISEEQVEGVIETPAPVVIRETDPAVTPASVDPTVIERRLVVKSEELVDETSPAIETTATVADPVDRMLVNSGSQEESNSVVVESETISVPGETAGVESTQTEAVAVETVEPVVEEEVPAAGEPFGKACPATAWC